MDLDRQRRLLDASLDLMEMDEPDRQARLARIAVEDPDFHAELLALLDDDQHTRLGGMVEEVTANLMGESWEAGQRVGPYVLEHLLGEGGMGQVYLAAQEEPIKRKVALKVIKAGYFGPGTRERFEIERKTLAIMDHPAIALAFEAASDDKGQPYIAMEYVDGEPIDRFCDQHRLDLTQRIALFLEVAEGIQHAHQRGIIHRDIKPSNILVKLTDDGPRPKIIDFGIAKAFEGDLAAEKTLTRQSAIIGSLDYMSPEQLLGEPIDIRSDVYALTMVLHQILVGELPFANHEDNRSNPIFERVSLLGKGFSRPSTRLLKSGERAESVAANRHTTINALYQQLRSELDWVVLAGLEEDREKRFPSASDLIADLRRYLRNEPLLVRPPSLTYKVRKFAVRHKTATLAALVSVTAVLVGTVLAVAGLLQARVAQRVANLEASKARAINAFLEEMLWSPDPHKGGKDIKVRDVLDGAAGKLDDAFKDQHEVRIALTTTIGKTFHQVGTYDRAVSLLQRAVDQGPVSWARPTWRPCAPSWNWARFTAVLGKSTRTRASARAWSTR